MNAATPLPPAPCRRCTRADEVIRGLAPRRALRGLRHQRYTLALHDERALAFFVQTFPEVLTHDCLRYQPQGEGLDPRPVWVSDLAWLKYLMWAEDHGVGAQAVPGEEVL